MAQVDSETSTAMLGESPGPLYIPTDVTPEELFQAIGRLRKEARDEIDRLIRFLDESDNHMAIEDCAIDDDPCDTDEFEIADGDDEPSLGSHVLPSGAVSYSLPVSSDGSIDCEGDEHDGREPDVDDEDGGDKEPSYGWNEEEAARVRYPSLMGARAEHEGDL